MLTPGAKNGCARAVLWWQRRLQLVAKGGYLRTALEGRFNPIKGLWSSSCPHPPRGRANCRASFSFNASFPSSPSAEKRQMPWVVTAVARKLAGISQSRPPPAFTGGLLYRSYRSGSSGSRKRSLPWRVLTIGAISVAGGLVLSAVNDLAIFHGCTTKAIEQAQDNPKVIEAIGVPIARGPWYDASLVVGHRRRSVSCTFPVSGPHGSGFLQINAIRNGEDGLLSFLRHHDWEILTMEAHLHVPSDDEDQKTLVKVVLVSNDRVEHREPESES